MMARRRRRGYCRTGRESRVGVMTDDDDDDDGVASASGLTISRRVDVWAHYLSVSFLFFFPSSFTFSVRFTAEFSFLIYMGHGLLPPGLAGWAMGCCYQMPIAATEYLFTNSFILNYFKNSSK